MTVPTPVNEGSGTTVPPLAASYHVRVSPVLTVAVAVKGWPLSQAGIEVPTGGEGATPMVSVTAVRVVLVQPVVASVASA